MVGPAISPGSMGAPSSVVTMPTRSGCTRYTWSASPGMPWAAASRAVITSNRTVLMRYVPAVRMPSWRPFSPPPFRNARASWKLSQSTTRPRMRSGGMAAPAAATTRPISPCGMTVTDALRTEYCQSQYPKWSPGASVSAW